MFRSIPVLILVGGTAAAAVVLEGGAQQNGLGLTAFLVTFFIPLFAVLGIGNLKDRGRAFVQAFGGKISGEEAKLMKTRGENCLG